MEKRTRVNRQSLNRIVHHQLKCTLEVQGSRDLAGGFVDRRQLARPLTLRLIQPGMLNGTCDMAADLGQTFQLCAFRIFDGLASQYKRADRLSLKDQRDNHAARMGWTNGLGVGIAFDLGGPTCPGPPVTERPSRGATLHGESYPFKPQAILWLFARGHDAQALALTQDHGAAVKMDEASGFRHDRTQGLVQIQTCTDGLGDFLDRVKVTGGGNQLAFAFAFTTGQPASHWTDCQIYAQDRPGFLQSFAAAGNVRIQRNQRANNRQGCHGDQGPARNLINEGSQCNGSDQQGVERDRWSGEDQDQ